MKNEITSWIQIGCASASTPEKRAGRVRSIVFGIGALVLLAGCALFTEGCGKPAVPPKPTDSRTWTAQCGNGVTMTLLRCPVNSPGDPDSTTQDYYRPTRFLMGSVPSELGRTDRERLHWVVLTKQFWLGKYEVTQEQYEAVMGENPSGPRGKNLPVVNVTWSDAMAFCRKLTEKEKASGHLPEGYIYTLPTESQWEYACRAGMTTSLNNGKNLTDIGRCPNLDQVAWYIGNSGATIHTPGGKQPNGWGFYDMLGNVWEWCYDWYEGYPRETITDPVGPPMSLVNWRIMRGGSCNNYADACRCACRGFFEPYTHNEDRGFRLALLKED